MKKGLVKRSLADCWSHRFRPHVLGCAIHEVSFAAVGRGFFVPVEWLKAPIGERDAVCSPMRRTIVVSNNDVRSNANAQDCCGGY